MKNVISVLIFLFSALTVFGYDDPESRKTLKGLEKIYVTVSVSNEVYPVTKTNITTDIELMLRREGITLGDSEQTTIDVNDAALIVEIGIAKLDDIEVLVYEITVSIYQHALLPRIDKYYGVVTWSTGGFGSVGSAKVASIRNLIKDQVDVFLNAYLSVNPK